MAVPTCPFKAEDLRPQGSAWVLANFHTHTPGSTDFTKSLRPSETALTPREVAQGILDDCVEKGVRVVALTDHNSPSFVRRRVGGELVADPEQESYYALMRGIQDGDLRTYGGILVLPGVEIGAENIHVLGIFPQSPDPGWDALHIAAILEDAGCPAQFYGDHLRSCTELSVSDAVDIIHNQGGIAIPAHIDDASGFLEEEKSEKRLLALILSRPHLFAVEYIENAARRRLMERVENKHFWDVVGSREGSSIAWTQSSDSHFAASLNPARKTPGKAIGTPQRRTWLKLDPGALSFDGVRAALKDPANRVRVDSTSHPLGRQGEYQPLPNDRTYLCAVQIDLRPGAREKMQLSRGVNALAGPPGAGKSTRISALAAASGRAEMVESGERPAIESVDLLLQCGAPGTVGSLWWVHRSEADSVYVAPMKVEGVNLKVEDRSIAKAVPLPERTGESDGRGRAVRDHMEDLKSQGKAPRELAIPQAFSLDSMSKMLADRTRLARFVEWHYVPDDLRDSHRDLHEALRDVTEKRTDLTAAQLRNRIQSILRQLQDARKAARKALNDMFEGEAGSGLHVLGHKGEWENDDRVLTAAQAILALDAPREGEKVLDILGAVEDTVELELRLPQGVQKPGGKLEDALKGILLVSGARDVGPVVVDAPEDYFEPAELTSTLAPVVRAAADNGTQFLIAADDPNIPFAMDADLLLICVRDRRRDAVAPIDGASGGLDRPDTAAWALRNLDGGGDLLARRQQLYGGVIGAARAASRRQEAEAMLDLSERRT